MSGLQLLLPVKTDTQVFQKSDIFLVFMVRIAGDVSIAVVGNKLWIFVCETIPDILSFAFIK